MSHGSVKETGSPAQSGAVLSAAASALVVPSA